MTTYTIEPQIEIMPAGELERRWVKCGDINARRWVIMDGQVCVAVAMARAVADSFVAALKWYRIPMMAPGERIVLTRPSPDPLQWLYDAGFVIEHTGHIGGDRLRYDEPSGWHVIISGMDGTDLPAAHEWLVGAYGPDVVDCDYSVGSDAGLSLRQAVAAALAIVQTAEAAPSAPVPQVAEKAVYISRREEAAVLAALRLLEVRVRENSLGQEFEAIMANAGPPLTAPQIELLADALGNDTYLAVTTVAPEGR